jgi:hypothetical protein
MTKSGDEPTKTSENDEKVVKITTGDLTNVQGVSIGHNVRTEIHNYTGIIVRVDTLEELEPKPGEPPYKGLAYFTERDSDIFIGREKLSADLAVTLQEKRFLVVVGASGSGKSSLLRAGVASRLRAQNWLIHIITPTANPLLKLANSLTRDDPALTSAGDIRQQLATNPDALRMIADKLVAGQNKSRMLLIVDQFEELYTQCNNYENRRQFIDNLLSVVAADSSVSVIVGLRADFTGKLAEPEAFRQLVQDNFELLGSIEQEDLVRVIMEPARLGGWAFVNGLVEQILHDVGREPGRLPLLSHALLETWKRRSAHVMTLGGYHDAGGVDGAIAKTAEDTLQQLRDDDKKAIMQAIFLELTELGEGSEDTRRIARRTDLAHAGDPSTVDDVLERLIAARLVTVDKGHVEVAHEALIRGWPRLQEWLADNRERLRFERRLGIDAELWEELHRDESVLYHGARLAQAVEFLESEEITLDGLPAEFFKVSRELAEREEHERELQRQRELELERRAHRRMQYLFATFAVAFLIALAFLIYPSILSRFAIGERLDIGPGTFQMGRNIAEEGENCEGCFDNELPPHKVSLDGFRISKYEITNQQYNLCVRARSCSPPDDPAYNQPQKSELPVTGVSWGDAQVFCTWAGGGRLPTEAEWEYAARGPDSYRYPWGQEDASCDLANTIECNNGVVPVGSYPDGRSWIGAHHLAGNVWEWVKDWYDPDYYHHLPDSNPQGPEEGSERIIRGGSFDNVATDARSARRRSWLAGSVLPDLGFRCVWSN